VTPDAYTVEPWCVREPRLRLDLLAETESAFTLSNGGIGIRGTFDEGDPVGTPGTYLAGLYELRTMTYTETAYGQPEETQTLVNTIDGTLLRLSVDGQPMDLRSGTVERHERELDLRTGTLRRELCWCSPAQRRVEVRSERLVSFAHRGVAAIRYTVRAMDEPVEIGLGSGLVANRQQPHLPPDPTSDDLLQHPLGPLEHHVDGHRLLLLHRTHRSELVVAATADHRILGPPGLGVHVEADEDRAGVTASARLAPGEELTIVKLLGYAWSGDRSPSAVRDEVEATIGAARQAGWAGLVAEQREYLDAFWADADVEVEGDDELQQAVRFALFHMIQATARAEGRAIASRGLTGTGYEGHTLWDTDTFVLQAMTALRPEITRQALSWRHATLPAARERARKLDLRGAAFPWRTIAGAECSGYWPAGTAALHVNADIADAVIRYVEAAGDEAFARTAGLDLLVETARLWAGFGHHGTDGAFHMDGVTGPDEYSALADDNVYTNLMARQNLLRAARWASAYPDDAARLGVDAAEIDGWQAAGEAMAVPYDERRQVHQQAAGFTDRPRWDFAGTDPGHYPLQSHFPYLQLYRKQVVKQADLVLALHLCCEGFTAAEKVRDFAYYEGVTVRDSSLSAPWQAVVAAEVGHLELAHTYLAESALADLRDGARDSSDGLHLAASAGTWIGLVAGFGGLRQIDGTLHFRPALPESLRRLTFRVRHRGRALRVSLTADEVEYLLVDGAPLPVRHDGEELRLTAGAAVTRPAIRLPQPAAPAQPAHREPHRRSAPPA
jgi:alpha,alpha-trehalose phosphorylase